MSWRSHDGVTFYIPCSCMSMQTSECDTTKRSKSTTFLTSVRPKKRVPLRYSSHGATPMPIVSNQVEVDVASEVPEHDSRGLCWSDAELRALVEFLGVGANMRVWEAAAAFRKG